MNDATKISLARIAAGTAIFITHMITGYNGLSVGLSLLLLGVPVEAVVVGKGKES